MDSVPRYEFYGIFGRLPKTFNIKSKCTEEEIEDELIKTRDKCLRKAKKAETSKDRAKFKRAAIHYNNLIEHGFAARVLYEARINPKGLIGMSLKYGIPEAKERILAQKRAQIRSRFGRRYWYRQ
jgi:hypothetical protein